MSGLAFVAAKVAAVAVANLYAWPLVVAAGCAVAALVAAPESFSGLVRRMSVDDEEASEGLEDGAEEGDELARRRSSAAGGEE